MAAETKGKRPWDDESQRGLDHSRTALRKASLSSPASGKYTPAQHEDRGGSLEEKRLPPRTTPNSMATFPPHILSPSPHRHVSLLAGSDERLQYYRENALSYMNGHKRQRIDPAQLVGEASVDIQRERGEGSAHGLQLQGLGRSAEMHETREGAMPLKLGAAVSCEQNLLRRPSQGSEPLYQTSTDDVRNAGQRAQCTTCSTLRAVVPCIVSGLCRLEKELSIVLATKAPDYPISRESDDQRGVQNIDQKGLCQSLDWVLGKVDCSIRMVKALMTSDVSPPGNTTRALLPNNLRIRSRSSGPGEVTSEERYSIAKIGYAQGSPRQSDDGSKFTEIANSGPTIPDRRNSVGEFRHHGIQSPHPTVSLANTIPTRPQSPMQAPLSSRLLPSPSSMNFPTNPNILPPMSPSLLLPKSPHTAHLQELQHQLSTKSLAHQILQGEHDKLLAAFSRSQIRCATLDKKSQVSDTEINDLSETNLRLQEQINAYEVQVEDLQQSRDEAWKQSVASGAQYTQIMAKSSQLQVQALADLRRWKGDREAWEREKRELMAKVDSYNVGRNRDTRECKTAAPTNMAPTPDQEQFRPNTIAVDKRPDEVHHSDSIRLLREEITRLQERNRNAEMAVSRLREESVYIEEIIGKLGGVHRRIQESSACTNSQAAPGSSVGLDIDATPRDLLGRL